MHLNQVHAVPFSSDKTYRPQNVSVGRVLCAEVHVCMCMCVCVCVLVYASTHLNQEPGPAERVGRLGASRYRTVKTFKVFQLCRWRGPDLCVCVCVCVYVCVFVFMHMHT